jgi:hypothetical protein
MKYRCHRHGGTPLQKINRSQMEARKVPVPSVSIYKTRLGGSLSF